METSAGSDILTFDDFLQDVYALEQDRRTYERKYSVLSETFYESYVNGEEPPVEAWVQDWTAWASAHKLWLRRRAQYRAVIQSLRGETQTIAEVVAETARHEPIETAS